jgi:hypothetical protein
LGTHPGGLRGSAATPCITAVPGLDVLSESDSAVIVGKRYREWLSGPDSFAFLAEEDGRLVGYVVGFYDEPHFMWSTGRVGRGD